MKSFLQFLIKNQLILVPKFQINEIILEMFIYLSQWIITISYQIKRERGWTRLRWECHEGSYELEKRGYNCKACFRRENWICKLWWMLLSLEKMKVRKQWREWRWGTCVVELAMPLLKGENTKLNTTIWIS